jgi:hypothetical protein
MGGMKKKFQIMALRIEANKTARISNSMARTETVIRSINATIL